MTLSSENILLLGSILLFLSIVASKTSFKLGIPTLILFLVVGMLAGSEGPGGIYFDDPKTAQFMGVVALTLILFSGGLDTKLESIRPVLKDGIALSTLGGRAADNANLVLAGVMIAMLPPITVFLLAQRTFVENVASSGLKG